ncbi:dkgA [Symbiodinium sp. CCMP2592]|nr:dkgA [Symbiodinium sp. CCMP2592]
MSLGLRHTRVNDILATFGEEETITSRRPSSLPGGLDSQGGAGFGYFQDRLKDLESAMQPQLRNRAKTEDLRIELAELAPDRKLDGLVKEGYITEDFSRLVYEKFRNEEEPVFLEDLQLEKTGGLNAVRELDALLAQKYFWFVVLIVSVIFNVWYLIHLDWQIFTTYFREVFHTWDLPGIADRLANGGGSESKSDIQAELFDDPMFKGSVFGMISDHKTRLTIVTAAVMVAIWEVGWLMVQVVWVVYVLYMVCCEQSEYKRYNAIGYFFQTLLPQASTFSAVKLMARVHPSLILNEYHDWVTSFSERGWCGHRRNTIGWIMRAVSFKVVNPDISWWYRLFSILATLNQIMGAVYIDRVLQDRVFLFVFGGRDATYEDDELAYKNAYMTRMVREIWVKYSDSGHYFSAIVLLATFDHYDLQWLMIEETEDDDDYVLQRLGLAPQRTVSAPAEGLTSRPKKATSGIDDTTWWNKFWTMLGCHTISRVQSSPELDTVHEDFCTLSAGMLRFQRGASTKYVVPMQEFQEMNWCFRRSHLSLAALWTLSVGDWSFAFASAPLAPVTVDKPLRNGRSVPTLGLQVPEEGPHTTIAWATSFGYRMLDIEGNESSAGQAIRGSSVSRSRLFLSARLPENGFQEAHRGMRQSLQLLRVDYVDLYMMVSPTKLIETWDAMVEMRKMGLARSLGVCDFELLHLETLKSHGRELPEVLQLKMNPFTWHQHRALLDWCERHGVLIQVLLRWAIQMDFQAPKDEDEDVERNEDRPEKAQEQATPEDRPRRRSMSENLSHKASAASKITPISLKLPSSDGLGPVASERSGQEESALSETPHTNRNSVMDNQDYMSESSQPLLFPVQDPAGSDLASRESTHSSTGMAAIARAFQSRCNALGDSWNGWTEGTFPKRAGYLAWADGWSDSGIPMSRSDSNELVDLDHLFTSHEVLPGPHVKGDDMV